MSQCVYPSALGVHKTVQLDLNLMLVRTVPMSKNTHFACVQPGTHVFIDLHADVNPSHVTHGRIVHIRANLGTQYVPASTSNTRVTKVHAGKKLHASVFTFQYWLPMVSPWHLAASLIYLLAITYHAFH